MLQSEPAFVTAPAAYRVGKADFADYLILAGSGAAGYPLVTFDKRLLKTEGVLAVRGFV